MIDCPKTEFIPEILKFRFSLLMVKDDWPPFLYLPRILPEILKFRFSLHMGQKMIDPASLSHLPRISPEILKFRFGLHMVKDDWPPTEFYLKF